MIVKKKILRSLVFFLSGFLIVFFANNSFAKTELSFVVATVNNHIITYADLEDRYRFVISSSNIKVNSKEEKNLLFNQIIDKMIDEELIRQEAKKLGITIDENEVNQVIESLATKQKKSIASFKQTAFSQKNLSFEAFKNQIRADILWSKIISESLKSKIKITDLEIKEFLEQQKLSTDVTKFLVAEIFIPNDKDAKLLANKLALELKNGANFNNIVKQFSRSPSAENNGEIGWVSKSDIDKKMYAAIASLEKNSYSEAVFLAEGYYIFKLLDKKSITQIKDDDLLLARNRIFNRGLEIEAKRYLMELHKSSFIEILVRKNQDLM